MALTVGTDSYVSVEDAEAYIAAEGLATLSDAEPLLKRATTALDRIYGQRFIGRKRQYTQALYWPRADWSLVAHADDGGYWAMDSDGEIRDFALIPPEVEAATVELAVLMDAGFDPYAQPDPALTAESVQVDVVTQNRTFARPHHADPFYKLNVILRPLLAPRGQIRLVR